MADVKAPEPIGIGDVVTLNSGGSPMTVTAVLPMAKDYSVGQVSTAWEAKDGTIKKEDFPALALKVTTKAPDPNKPTTTIPPK
jgi:uncharacterized protein YodC (DUF2158 family)